MNSYEYKIQLLLMRVLNGNYPASSITKMSTETLEMFVKHLVKRTSKSLSDDKCKFKKPKWWPKDVEFTSELHFSKEGMILFKSTLKQLIIKCSDYYNSRRYAFKQKWLPSELGCKYFHKEENDENLCLSVINKRVRKKCANITDSNPPKKIILHQNNSKCGLPPTPPPVEADVCFEGADVPEEPNFVLIPNQTQFLNYFQLDSSGSLPPPSPPATPSHLGTLKLSNCPQVPFSSNIGRAMTINENYTMPEELKLRRLEKTEWYLSGKSVIKCFDQEYEVTYTSKNGDEQGKVYRFPKRQFHQQHRSLYDTPFVRKYFESVYVRVERMDLKKIQRKLRVHISRMELKQISPYLCRNVKVVVVKSELPELEHNPLRRYSPRLRSL